MRAGLLGVTIYTFYCCKADGSATTFEAHELADDDLARDRASVLARLHPSCAYVAVYDADRLVLAGAQPTAGQPPKSGPVSIAGTQVDPAALTRVLKASAARHPKVALIATTLDGAVAYWNAAATNLYGWREDEVIGRNILDVTPVIETVGYADEIMRKLQKGEAWSGPITLRTRRAAAFPAFVADLPVAFKGDQGLIVGASARIAERQAVEACQAALLGDLQQVASPTTA